MNVDSRTGHGLDRQQVLRMLTSTIFDCAIYRGYGDRIARRDHSEGGFSMANGLKDARLIRDAAAATRTAMPLGAHLAASFEIAAMDPNISHLDWSALALPRRAAPRDSLSRATRRPRPAPPTWPRGDGHAAANRPPARAADRVAAIAWCDARMRRHRPRRYHTRAMRRQLEHRGPERDARPGELDEASTEMECSGGARELVLRSSTSSRSASSTSLGSRTLASRLGGEARQHRGPSTRPNNRKVTRRRPTCPRREDPATARPRTSRRDTGSRRRRSARSHAKAARSFKIAAFCSAVAVSPPSGPPARRWPRRTVRSCCGGASTGVLPSINAAESKQSSAAFSRRLRTIFADYAALCRVCVTTL